MTTWFSADYHFHHQNVIKYDNRPFISTDQMNKVIIRKHNERVKQEDTVYFLGDFGFFASKQRAFRGEGEPYNPNDLLNKMNGEHWQFVGGNHDKTSNKFKTKTESIILNQNGLKIKLVHNPIYAQIEYDLTLCGHVHTAWRVKELFYCGEVKLIINVGCCVWNYYPVRLDEILSVYYKWKSNRKTSPYWKSSKIVTEYNKGTLCLNK